MAALAGLKRNRDRRLRTLEVVDVDPIAGSGHGRGILGEQPYDRLALLARAKAAQVDVVAGGVNPDCESDGVERARLSDHFFRITFAHPGERVGRFRWRATQLSRAELTGRRRRLELGISGLRLRVEWLLGHCLFFVGLYFVSLYFVSLYFVSL